MTLKQQLAEMAAQVGAEKMGAGALTRAALQMAVWVERSEGSGATAARFLQRAAVAADGDVEERVLRSNAAWHRAL